MLDDGHNNAELPERGDSGPLQDKVEQLYESCLPPGGRRLRGHKGSRLDQQRTQYIKRELGGVQRN